MKIQSIIRIFVTLILLISLASATEVSFEKATVGRIVGDNPDELLRQLTQEDLTLKHATYYTEEADGWELFGYGVSTRAREVSHIIEDEFQEASDRQLGLYQWPPTGTEWKKNELIILEPEYSTPGQLCFQHPDPHEPLTCKTPIGLGWDNNVKRTKPLILIDSDYAGLYVPKNHEDYESFVGELGQDSTMIAPTAIPDREFVKAFVCNLALYATYEYVPDDQKNSIGKIYRKARNSYYWQSNRPSGLALMSYELYGLPYLKVSVPHATTDEKTWDYCVQYWQYNMKGTVSSGYSFMEEQVFQTGEINITPIQVNKTTIENITITENFTLLTTENTQPPLQQPLQQQFRSPVFRGCPVTPRHVRVGFI